MNLLNFITLLEIPLALFLGYILLSYLKHHKKQMPFLSTLGFDPIDDGVLIIVPAKDEQAGIGLCLERLTKLKNLRKFKIVAVDDRSTDDTRTKMNQARAVNPEHVEVVSVTNLPSDWLGKNHACWQGVQAGLKAMPDAKYILFTDGDVKLHEDAVAESITWMNKSKIDFLTLIEHAEFEGILEPAYLMLFGVFIVFFSTRPWLLNKPKGKNFMGNGAYILVRRDVYEKTAAHKTLRLEVVEDLRMGLLMRSLGYRCAAAIGLNRIWRRWQPGFKGIFKGLLKNSFAAFEYSVPLTLIGILFFPFVFLMPWFSLFSNYPLIGGLNVLLLSFCYYLASKDSELPFFSGFILSPVASLAASVNLATSAFMVLKDGGVKWRNSFYSLKNLKEQCFTIRKAFDVRK